MTRLVGGVKWVALETIVSRLLQLLSALFVARVLGPEVMGTVALILVALEIFRLFSEMGITQALIHHKNPTGEQLATLYSLNWMLAATVYIAIFFSAPFIASFFDKDQLMSLLIVAGLSVLISALSQQVFALLQKEMRFKVTSVISMIASTINVIAAVTLVSLGWGVWSIVISQLLASAIRSGLAFIYGLRNNLFSGFGLSFNEVKPMLSFGLYQTGAMSMNMINSRADQLIIGKVMGTSALGFYSVGSQITLQAMQQINSIATRVAFPAVSHSQDDLDEVKRIYLTMIANVLLVSAPLFIGLSVVSQLFVDVVLGERWTKLGPVLSILCGYVLVRSLGNMNGPLVMGLGKANWSFYWNLGLLFIIPAVVFLSSVSGDIENIALALMLTQLILLVVAYFYWVRRLLGPCAKEYFGTIAKPLFSAVAMGSVVTFAYDLFNGQSNVVTLLLLIFLGAISYFLFSMVFNAKNLLGFAGNVFTKKRLGVGSRVINHPLGK